jgi:FKBP-type peptidyl-prolyl cis-trans isomerase FklB
MVSMEFQFVSNRLISFSLSSTFSLRPELHAGTGKTPTIDSPCDCHYSGTLIDGTEFDSSYKRGQPLTFAPNQVIKGWTEAMQLMKEGGKWELFIPSELAYGDSGAGGAIPGGAALIFTLELLEVKGDFVKTE